ncbi:protein tyrosine phosphatase family protein [Shewanella youngdeokensis]|uniref:Protein tyrosine phosphatase family protein n=1 Tax=Shewanella youngdeokensis TaxID=2999068 RepID=A0ABZ0K190_9GAMM|nr:protein tyrosine phosphatase family protein [Shewanella sp. DAU334]
MRLEFLLAGLLVATLNSVAFANVAPSAETHANMGANIDVNKLTSIKAFQFNNSNIVTSGLPTETQFAALQQAGIELVINLIPKNNPNSHNDEASLVTRTGMQYQQIDVDWQRPTVANVEQFFAIMDANEGKNILVHCAANYRASAFYYLYELKQGRTDSVEFKQQTMQPWGDLPQSLAAYPQWKALIDAIKNR